MCIILVIQNDPDPKAMAESKKRSDWNQWKNVIQAEITSLSKIEVFTHAMPAYTSWNLPYGIQMGFHPETK
jgi:hypothetical protein